jgi:deazaflavin-dependent oxidoreductase (nitroreductase family)
MEVAIVEQRYVPSPNDFAADHVARYESSGGRDGGVMSGAPIIVLHTTGRRSGALRKSPLIKVTDGDRYVVIASRGGAPAHPAWYLNVVAEPRVRVQDGDRVVVGAARTAVGDERRRLWKAATQVWPDYDEYQRKTAREIPVVVIEPA